jgi:HD superfamily phosphohydrolase
VPRGKIEIRDPVHVFVELDDAERALLDSTPFQRLRHVNQLALSYLVYPGATHRRFEHSLGVMDLATRIFDVVVNDRNIAHDSVRELLTMSDAERSYWRMVLRMAALCHDLGHLPFSHASEELLPDGWDHERISREYIRSDALRSVWAQMKPAPDPDDVGLIAVGPSLGEEAVAPWEAVLNEIITGDVFGADRMDYLLRDSLHAGVAYGRFDHNRLIDTLRILPAPPGAPGDDEPGGGESATPELGIEHGGVQSAEALLLARYFMFSQVYMHRTRRIYDIHLADFMKEWLLDRGGQFPVEPLEHLRHTDNEVLTAIAAASKEDTRLGTLARRIVDREERFRLLYEPKPEHQRLNADAARQVAEATVERYGDDAVRFDSYDPEQSQFDFPVQTRDGDIASSAELSDVLARVPVARFQRVYLDCQYLEDAYRWLKAEMESLIGPPSDRGAN